MSPDLTNKFFNISQFPSGWGKVVFPISLSKISTSQNPNEIFTCLEILQKAVRENKIGCDLIYGDMLYMWNVDRDWKEYAMKTIDKHKKGFIKELQKRKLQFQIEEAFNFFTWTQLYLGYEKTLFDEFQKLRSLVDSDPVFKSYLIEDAKSMGRELTEAQIGFFIEEHLLFLSLLFLETRLPNSFTKGRESWVLFCYPGVPPKHFVYMYQKNLLGFKNPSSNPYMGQYDWTKKKFYDFNNIDLNTWDGK